MASRAPCASEDAARSPREAAAPPPVECLAEFVCDDPAHRTTAYAAWDPATGASAHGWVNVVPCLSGLHIHIGMRGLCTLRLPLSPPVAGAACEHDELETYKCTARGNTRVRALHAG